MEVVILFLSDVLLDISKAKKGLNTLEYIVYLAIKTFIREDNKYLRVVLYAR